MTACSDSGATVRPALSACGSEPRGNFCIRSSRSEDRPAARARSAAVAIWVAWVALPPPEAVAAAARVIRPARPVESRLGSTMPSLTFWSPDTLAIRSVYLIFAFGQPKDVVAIGSGTATTIGLRAIGLALAGTLVGLAARRRCSHSDESGTHTSGMRVLPLAWPTPVRDFFEVAAIAAATSAGAASMTSTSTQASSDLACADQSATCSFSAGAMSAGALIESFVDEPHDAWENFRNAYQLPARTTSTATAAAPIFSAAPDDPAERWRPFTALILRTGGLCGLVPSVGNH